MCVSATYLKRITLVLSKRPSFIFDKKPKEQKIFPIFMQIFIKISKKSFCTIISHFLDYCDHAATTTSWVIGGGRTRRRRGESNNFLDY